MYFLVLPQQNSLLVLYGSVLLPQLENIAPAASPILIINSSNIFLPRRTILEVKRFDIENVFIMIQVGMYGEI